MSNHIQKSRYCRLALLIVLFVVPTLLAACPAPPPPRYKPTPISGEETVTPTPTVTATPTEPAPEFRVDAGGVAITHIINLEHQQVEAYDVISATLYAGYPEFIDLDQPVLDEDFQIEAILLKERGTNRIVLYSTKQLPADATATVWRHYSEVRFAEIGGESDPGGEYQWVFARPVAVDETRPLDLNDVSGNTLHERLNSLGDLGIRVNGAQQILISRTVEGQTEYRLFIFAPEFSGAGCNMVAQYCSTCGVYCWVCRILTAGC